MPAKLLLGALILPFLGAAPLDFGSEPETDGVEGGGLALPPSGVVRSDPVWERMALFYSTAS